MLKYVEGPTSESNKLYSTLTSGTTPFLLNISIQDENPIHTKAFINSGAMGNFIHPRLVEEHQLKTHTRPTPLSLQTVTGKVFTSVTQQVTTVMTTRHRHTKTITFNVTPIGKHNIILGLPWCTKHEIQIDWKNHEIVRWSPNCKNQCFGTIASIFPTTDLLVRKLVEDAIPPVRATPGSIGYDIHTTNTITIPPKTRTLVGTGIAIATPKET